MDIQIFVADTRHYPYAAAICTLIEEAAKARGTGIAKREPEYVRRKMEEGKAVIALAGEDLAGFCYIETWDHNRYVANSGLIVAPDYRKYGLARQIKAKAFELSRKKYPEAKLFGITTSLPVMKINSDLGYRPVTFSELTTDEVFWKGCQSCPNYDILTRNERKLCLCTGMLYDPASEEAKNARKRAEDEAAAKQREGDLEQRWERFKAHLRKRRSNTLLQRIRENIFGKEAQKASDV
ncbi:MAG: GNAT family N-acetyltransferase [Bacteroidetes bacterium]|nr:MAG: GNAT family N-acetyltransferase [Bacteroidota bacterium]